MILGGLCKVTLCEENVTFVVDEVKESTVACLLGCSSQSESDIGILLRIYVMTSFHCKKLYC